MQRKSLLFAAISLLFILAYFWIKTDFVKTPDTLYFNGNILTINEKQPNAQAMYVKNGHIEAIGSDEDMLQSAPKNIHKVDLKGTTVMPGFIDPHTHVALSSFLENMVDLSGFTHSTDEQVWSQLEKEVQQKKVGEWIVGKGIDPILIEGLKTPNIAFLDDIAPENPVLLLAQSLHTYWANTAAFEKVGITKDSPNPSSSSYYEKDSLGNLTGVIVEQAAFNPFVEELQKDFLSAESLIKSTTNVFTNYAQNGNTSVVSTGLSINDAKPLRLYEHISSNTPTFFNQLLSVLGFLPKRKPYPRHFIYIRHDRASLLPPTKDNSNDFYNILGIKHWYDGSPYTGSMYLKEPYLVSDLTTKELHIPEGSRGKALIDKTTFVEFIKKYHSAGWQISIHTQGGIAIEETLAAFEAANHEVDITQARHRLEHCLLLPDTCLQKMQALNITPSFHINHLYYYGKALKEDILGEERANKILPLANTQKQNIRFTLHADQPMFESQPFRLIQTAVERQTQQGEVLGESQKIDVLTALKSLTIDAAWQIGMEDKLGSLEVGKYADFIVVDKNPLEVSVAELEDIEVRRIFVGGNEVNGF